VIDAELKRAHRCAFENEDSLRDSATCGCFYCLAVLTPSDVVDWTTERSGRKTSLCPKCGIDSVLGSASGFPITVEFLQKMRAAYF
jgi:hypothetical protein